MLHSLFSDTVIFSNKKKIQRRLATADSADKQLNISRHASTIHIHLYSPYYNMVAQQTTHTSKNTTKDKNKIISWDLVSKKFPQCTLDNKIQNI